MRTLPANGRFVRLGKHLRLAPDKTQWRHFSWVTSGEVGPLVTGRCYAPVDVLSVAGHYRPLTAIICAASPAGTVVCTADNNSHLVSYHISIGNSSIRIIIGFVETVDVISKRVSSFFFNLWKEHGIGTSNNFCFYNWKKSVSPPSCLFTAGSAQA